MISLPFKYEMSQPELGDSRKCAIATQFQLERRFERNPNLQKEYEKFIRESIALRHIEKVAAGSTYGLDSAIHYMPHYCVFKNSTTTALRVVYNASPKTSNGISLNEQLAIGRTKQTDIVSLLINFRLFKYVFTSDVEKMYKQIMLDEKLEKIGA